ncbi:MAG TPA: endo-1,4-beta-xylanase [Bacteroidales bacterium]|nr:endo-1,4-beta-xylanase [Bacteroidales bacterium]
MKNLLIRRSIISAFACLITALLLIPSVNAQTSATDEAIAKYRKGQLVIKAKKGSQVKVEQLRHEFWFGAAIPNSLAGRGMSPENLKMFKQKFLENFNSAVTENSLKWAIMEPQKDKEDYSVTDSILAWTTRNNIPLRGHNLFWGIFKSPNTGQQYVQQWVADLSDEELRQRIHDRAIRITKYYKGRFAEYDMNNEMIHGDYYEDRLGPGIVKQMATWGHEGDPDAKFWLNDYDILIKDSPLGIGLPEYMAHIRRLLKEGVPISGIGVQGHSFLETFDRQYVKSALDSLAKFGLPIRITEFNLPGMRSTLKNAQLTPEQEANKAKEIVDFYKLCFAHPAVEGIIMWGFWEGANWVPSSSMYKRDWTPTPTAEAYKNLVFKEWWTNTSGVTDKKGVYTVPAFYGKYRVTVNGVSKEVDLKKAEGKMTVDFGK